MSEINFHYAVQICDVENSQNLSRFCGNDRSLLSKKSLASFFESVKNCADNVSNSIHTIKIFNDRSTQELLDFTNYLIKKYSNDQIKVSIENIVQPGLANSIKQCYLWLQVVGKDLVYQVQDDYMFLPDAILEMYQIYDQMKKEINYDIIVSPFNDYWLWLAVYRNSVTPRTVVCGSNRYWIQYYDMSCSFMTTHKQFSQHWDLYHAFFELVDKKDPKLESQSLNYMLTQRGVLGLIPINSLAFHMQSDLEKDPHIPWQPIWDNIDVTIPST